MATATSVHVKPALLGAVQHNRRETRPGYVFPDRTHLNEVWEVPGLTSVAAARAEVAQLYRQSVGQKMQDRAHPIHEAVVVINEDTTMEQVKAFAAAMQKAYGVRPIQIAIHRDEGYEDPAFDESAPEENRRYNYHAHILFKWCDDKGRTFKWSRKQGREFQDLAAQALAMNRGIESKKRHLSPQEYKHRQEMARMEREHDQMSRSLEEIRQQLAKGQQSLIAQNRQLEGFGRKIAEARASISGIQSRIEEGKLTLEEGQRRIEAQRNLLADLEDRQERKQQMVEAKTREVNELLAALSVRLGYTPLSELQLEVPVIPKPPLTGRDKWCEEQNARVREAVSAAYRLIFARLSADAEQQVRASQAKGSKSIRDLQASLEQREQEIRTQSREISRLQLQLEAERQPEKQLLTEPGLRPYGERGDHHRLSGRYLGLPFELSLSPSMERSRALGLPARDLALAHLPEILSTCFEWDTDLAARPDFRIGVIKIFLKLLDDATTPTATPGGGGSDSGLGWNDRRNEDEEERLQRFREDYRLAQTGKRGNKRGKGR